jgi:ubiquitin C-terminal hydrolase
MAKKSIIEAAKIEQNLFSINKTSMITRLFYGQTVGIRTCKEVDCRHEARKFEPFREITVPIGQKPTSLLQCLQKTYRDEDLDGFQCPACKSFNNKTMTALSYCPPILIFALSRFDWDNRAKKNHLVTFPEILDLTSVSAGATGPGTGKKGPFYECYAVVQHIGANRDSGHYWTLAQDVGPVEPGAKRDWFKFEDRNVTKTLWQNTQNASSYVLLYRRMDLARRV